MDMGAVRCSTRGVIDVRESEAELRPIALG